MKAEGSKSTEQSPKKKNPTYMETWYLTLDYGNQDNGHPCAYPYE